MSDTSGLPWPSIADALGSGLVLIDSRGVLVHWNAWMARHSGMAAEAVLGRDFEAVFGDTLSAPFKRALNNVLKHRLPVVLSNVLHRHPLPLYRDPAVLADDAADDAVDAAADSAANSPAKAAGPARMPQSVILRPIPVDGGEHLCMIQVTDTSMFVRRERVLQSNSDRLSKEALIDGLTGVYNRKFFNDNLPAELSRCRRQRMPLSLLMLDADAFKAYNDAYGHPAGDRVLVAIITAAHSQLNRSSDILARYGGEEFGVILSACDSRGAQLVAEKIRHAVAELRIPHAHSDAADHLTVSLGAATCGPDGYCSEVELLDAADRALYQAKRKGRNAVQWLPAVAAQAEPQAGG